MTSFLRYKQQLKIVQDADDIEEWITVRGNHIPIKKGQSKKEAVKAFVESKGGNSNTKNNKLESSKKESKKQINENFEKAKSSLPKEKVEFYLNKIGGINKKYDRLYSEASTKEEKEKILKEWSKNGNEIVKEMINKSKEAKSESSKKWSSAWKKQVKEDLAWFSKGKTAKQRQEAGYAALEISYNMEFGKNAAKNRSNLIKEVHNSGVEDPDYIEAILNNMEEKHFENQETFRKGLKNAKKKIEPSNKNLKED